MRSRRPRKTTRPPPPPRPSRPAERFRRISEAGFEGIAFTDEGLIVDVNPQLADLFGYPAADLTGLPFAQLIAPSSRAAFHTDAGSLGEGGTELRGLKRDGSTFPVEIRAKRVEWGKREFLVFVLRDITARKGTEQLLRESEENYRELAESITDVFFAVDHSLTITYWNKASEYFTGISARDAIGDRLFDLLPAMEGSGGREVFDRALRRREPQSFIAKLPVEEQLIITEIRIYPTLRGLSVYLEDITEQQRAEQALRESEERFRNLYEESPIGIQLCDAEGRHVHTNSAFRTILGVHDASAMGAFSLLHDPALTPEMTQALQEGRTVRFETVLEFTSLRGALQTQRDGTAHFDVQITPLGLRSRGVLAGYLIHMQDTTDRKRAEGQLKASLLEKEALLKEIHHRVKNNLQIVSSLLSLQSEYITNEKALEALQESQNRVRSMAMIHRQLYSSGDLARIDFAQYVRDLADQIFRTYSLLALTVKLELNVDPVPLAIDKAIPCGIIVNELITNSLKHAFRGQSSGTISVGMQTTAEGMLILSVGDDGVGIPEDMDLSASPSLGLKLVRTLADQLRGEVTIQRGRGMTLTIRFPSS